MSRRHSVITKAISILAVAMTAIAPLLFTTADAAHATALIPGICQSKQIHVSLAANQPADQIVSGTLCTPLWWSGQKHEVDILVHGATYNSTYWNWPVKTSQYSYVNDTLLAGRATFAYDALGTGNSSHPQSGDITIDTEAYVLNQVLGWAHGNAEFSRFVVVGHSFGSITAVYESSLYHDEDALVLTGFSHALNTTHAATAVQDLYSANQDPKFSGQGLDPGYLTSRPNTRGTLYYGGITDASIIASDEATKDIVPGQAFGQGIGQLEAPAAGNVANQITVPVLEVLGQEDYLFCGTGAPTNCSASSVSAYDAPYFSNTSLAIDTIPLTGHDLSLHPSNPLTFAEINAWINPLN